MITSPACPAWCGTDPADHHPVEVEPGVILREHEHRTVVEVGDGLDPRPVVILCAEESAVALHGPSLIGAVGIRLEVSEDLILSPEDVFVLGKALLDAALAADALRDRDG